MIERELVDEVSGPAAEGVVRVGHGNELLELEEVVEAERVVKERGTDAEAFAGLEEGGLADEAGGSGLDVEVFDGGAGFSVVAAQLRDAAVEFDQERDAGFACERDDGAGSGDGLGEAEDASIGGEGVGAEAVEVDAVKRGGFGVEIEERRRAVEGIRVLFCRGSGVDYDDFSAGLMVGLHVGSRAPGAVAAGYGVEVPVETPLVGVVFVFDEGEACSDAILRSDTADRDVHGLTGDEGLRATGEAAEVEALAGLESFAFATEVGVDAALVAGLRLRGQHGKSEGDEEKRSHGCGHDFFFECLAGACFFARGFFAAAEAAMAIPRDWRVDLREDFVADLVAGMESGFGDGTARIGACCTAGVRLRSAVVISPMY